MPWLMVKIRVKTDGVRKEGAGGTVTRLCAALRNIKVDSIAEDYLLDPCQPQTSDNAAHVDAQAVSICIQGTRVTGRYEDAIRESIDGSYLHDYLSAKHAWSDSM